MERRLHQLNVDVAYRIGYATDTLSVDDLDGHCFEFAEWRFNIRMSNTGPVVRLNVETRGDQALLEEKTAEVLAVMQMIVIRS